MKGIIYKDYLIAFLPKNIISYLVNTLVIISVVFYLPNVYGLILTVAISIPISGSCLLQKTMEQDELSNFDKLQLTFPITKKQIVLAKYFGGLIMQGFFQLISLFVMLYYYWRGVADIIICFQIWILGLVIALIFFGICYTGFYLLGNKKGLLLYLVMMIVIVVVYIFTFFNFKMISIYNFSYSILLILGIIFAVGVLVISYLLSLKLFIRKYN